MKTYRCGFTMIELLVVIAIIVILSGLMFPAINSMQEKGRIVTCTSNLKQLHQAAMNFAMANDGNLPFTASEEWAQITSDGRRYEGFHTGWVDWNATDEKTYWWDKDANGVNSVRNGSIFPYLGDEGDEGVYVCPTMSRLARKTYTSSADRADRRNVVARSYGMNGSLQKNDLSTYRYNDVDGASRTVLFADQGFVLQDTYNKSLMNYGDAWSDNELPELGEEPAGEYVRRTARNHDGCIDWRHWNNDADNKWQADGGNDNTAEHIGEYHNGRGNAVFLDGHVECIEYDNTHYICTGAWEAGRPIN